MERIVLVLQIIVVSIIIYSCESDHSGHIKEIWLSKDMSWQDSETGIIEIDTARKEAYTEILALYDDRLILGNISLYLDLEMDTIVIAYEAGEMLFTGNDCFKVKEVIIGESIITNKEALSFKGSDELQYSDRVFKRVDNMAYKNKHELNEVLRQFCQ